MKKVLEHINWIAFLVLLAAMPYPWQFIRFFWIVWLATWLLELRFLKHPQIELKRLTPFIGMIIWLLWNCISIIWTPDKLLAKNIIGTQINVLFMLPIALWGVNKNYDIKKCMKIIIVSSCIAIVVYLFAHYWVMNFEHAQDRTLPAVYHIDFVHLDTLLLDIKHRMHFTNFLCMAVLSVLFMAADWKIKFGRLWGYMLSFVILLWLSLGIFWTGSRLGMINLFIVVALFFIVRLKGRKRVIGITASVAAVAAVVALLFAFHPRFKAVYPPYMNYYIHEDSVKPTPEPRMAIWKIVFLNKDQYPIYGMGLGSSEQFLAKEYHKYELTQFEQRRYSAHNEFLTLWMELGSIAAVLMFLFWVFLPLCYQSGRSRQLAVGFTAVALTAMLTDHILSGLEGIVFVSVFMFLPLINESSDDEKN